MVNPNKRPSENHIHIQIHKGRIFEPVHEKTNNLGSDRRSDKEDGWRLEILDLESKGIVLSV